MCLGRVLERSQGLGVEMGFHSLAKIVQLREFIRENLAIYRPMLRMAERVQNESFFIVGVHSPLFRGVCFWQESLLGM